ncbi:hypothetical protein HUJ04_000193 [Dendroctonus ponderosae]|nr:hypothetical protein HUJ04_005313 [Dendroctonus ponderosae]KAH1000274.1 hypothetical protein HUJ04_000193 [Dendroctonus ponderosae]
MPLTLLTASLVLLLVLIVVGIVRKRPPGAAREPPMPLRLPIIGHLHLLRGYSVPYQAFTALKLRYGPVVRLQLGAVKCVVVNGQRHIREALVTRGHHFDFRPNFERYQRLFAGNKENSLAFCDWSSTQKARRDMLKAHTFPRAFTAQFQRLEGLVVEETGRLVRALSAHSTLQLKPLLLQTCANVFLSHFCSVRFGAQNAAFLDLLSNFDEVFFEVNQGYAADFLPFLMPLHRRKLQSEIRGSLRLSPKASPMAKPPQLTPKTRKTRLEAYLGALENVRCSHLSEAPALALWAPNQLQMGPKLGLLLPVLRWRACPVVRLPGNANTNNTESRACCSFPPKRAKPQHWPLRGDKIHSEAYLGAVEGPRWTAGSSTGTLGPQRGRN